ncbi:hypothetical protein JW926_08900 [Candidatus Sumerlaeota bacterium]|nr:hypothetical protein [Candidatus Sumerlaeota bacterium]
MDKKEMTVRERFNKVLHWQKPDRLPNMDFGYWQETIQRWHNEGLPKNVTNDWELETYLGLEGEARIVTIPLNTGLFPWFEYKVLEEKGEHVIYQDGEGVICEVHKSSASIPHYIKFGLETREDWQRWKEERLDYTNPARIGDVKKTVEDAHAAGFPVRIHAGSLYGNLRNWMGVENFSITLMSDKDWVEEMMEHLMQMTLYLIDKALPGLDVDVAWWWEDMCYNHGPLMSPKLFEELMVPRYKKITDRLKEYGIDVNILDCDGKIDLLVPGWLDAGINCMFPLEAAHTDAVKLRETYGRDLLLFGGVNKIALIQGKEAIDRELERIQPLIEQGGYIPSVDHRVPPDVSFENYLYYLEKRKEML